MHWELHFILQGIKPKKFKELATQAYDIKLIVETNVSENTSIEELEGDTRGGKSTTDEEEESVTSNLILLQLLLNLYALICFEKKKLLFQVRKNEHKLLTS